MSKKTEIRDLQDEIASLYHNTDHLGDLIESYQTENSSLESDNIELRTDSAELRAIIDGYERAEAKRIKTREAESVLLAYNTKRNKEAKMQAESDAKEARYLQQIADGLVSVELLRERLSDLSPSTSFAGITRTDLTVMLGSGSKVDEALLEALVKPKVAQKTPFIPSRLPVTVTDLKRIADLGAELSKDIKWEYKTRPYSQGLKSGPAGGRISLVGSNCNCSSCQNRQF